MIDATAPLHARRARDGGLFLLVLLLAAGVVASRYPTLPSIVRDVGMMVDFGNQFLHGGTRNVVLWEWDHPGGLAVPYVIGATLLETLVWRSGDPEWAARILALAWLVVAALVVRLYLLRRGASAWLAAVGGFAIFADPMLQVSARMARLDTLALALGFGALATCGSPAGGHSPWRARLAAGALSALACFCWPTALVFGPALLLELWRLSRRDDAPLASFVRSSLVVALGAVATATVLLAVVGLQVPEAFDGMRLLGAYESRNGLRPGALVLILGWLLGSTPALSVTAAACAVLAPERLPRLLAIGATLVGVLSAAASWPRVIYLFPLLVVILAAALTDPDGLRRRVAATLLVGTALVSSGVSAWTMVREQQSRPLPIAATGVVPALQRSGCERVLDLNGAAYFALRAAGVGSWSGIAFSASRERGMGYEFARYPTRQDYVEALLAHLPVCAVLIDERAASFELDVGMERTTPTTIAADDARLRALGFDRVAVQGATGGALVPDGLRLYVRSAPERAAGAAP